MGGAFGGNFEAQPINELVSSGTIHRKFARICTTLPRAAICVALFLALGCGQQLHRYEYAELHMGVQVRLSVYASDEHAAQSGCAAAFARIAQLEDIFSDYRPDSELMRLCRAPVATPVHVSRELFDVLDQAQELSEQSDGAFDVTVGPYVALWRAARKSHLLPTQAELSAAGRSVGWQYVKLDTSAPIVTLLHSDMRLDLGGIAKGYAGDEAIASLRKAGLTRALFEAGGDIVASDPPPGKLGWLVRINSPGPDTPPVIQIANVGVSTSGDSEQFALIDGVRYSHIVDPRTGIGLTDRIVATVIALNGTTADSLATALCVLGPTRGKSLMREYPHTRAYIRRIK